MSARLEICQLHAGYGDHEVIGPIDLRVAAGEVLAVLGRNGAGRSTLLSAIMGLLPRRGELRLDGAPVSDQPTHVLARAGLALVSETRDVFPTLSLRENLMLATHGSLLERRQACEAVLARHAWMQRQADQPAGTLSGGEQQWLCLMRALVQMPRVLLLDEPCEGLAQHWIGHVQALLAHARQHGCAVLLVDQRAALWPLLADRVMVLGRGEVRFAGSVSEFRNWGNASDWL
jgi:branched-chain amino acid transport system ATP-binding protein